jgi:hypothetical protein
VYAAVLGTAPRLGDAVAPRVVAPGFGISVVLLLAVGLLAGIESAVGGLVVGLGRR